ncbi:MAG: hypothetical protein H6643_04310 [Caldilineaceae bacterium]|nr:hypothetical protein [Caldilineaceae bacterium]
MLFLGWSGACSGYTLTYPITMIGDQQVGAGFAVAQYLHLPLIQAVKKASHKRLQKGTRGTKKSRCKG